MAKDWTEQTAIQLLEDENARLRSHNLELLYDNEQKFAEIERLGKEVNYAKYGNPDFAWSLYQSKMDELIIENKRLRYSLRMILDDLQATADIGYIPSALLDDHIYVTAKKILDEETSDAEA